MAEESRRSALRSHTLATPRLLPLRISNLVFLNLHIPLLRLPLTPIWDDDFVVLIIVRVHDDAVGYASNAGGVGILGGDVDVTHGTGRVRGGVDDVTRNDVFGGGEGGAVEGRAVIFRVSVRVACFVLRLCYFFNRRCATLF